MSTPATPNWDALIPIDPALQPSPAQHSYPVYPQQHYQPQTPTPYQVYQQQQQQYAAAAAAASNNAPEVEEVKPPPPPPPTSSRPILDRSRTTPLNPNFDPEILKPRLREIAAHHSVVDIPDEAVSYVALALRTRLATLVQQMGVAARHRTDTQFDRPASLYAEGQPMWSLVVRSDVAKQIAVLERVEREEETRLRRERKDRAEMTAAHAAALAAQAAGNGAGPLDYDDDGEGGKRKKKKDGPGVTARNMSEDVRKKMSNAVASQAAGIGGKYSWMTAGNAAAAATAKPAKPAGAGTSPSTSTNPVTTIATGGSGWARAYVPKKTAAATATAEPVVVEEDTRTAITLRDAHFVVDKERGHGGGRGSGKGWT